MRYLPHVSQYPMHALRVQNRAFFILHCDVEQYCKSLIHEYMMGVRRVV